MKWLVIALLAALLVGGIVLLPHLPGVRRLEVDLPQTCEGRFEGNWRLMPGERAGHPGLNEGCERLAFTIDESIIMDNTSYPTLWGSVVVDGRSRTWHNNFYDLVWNDGDSFVTDPCGQNCPLTVLIWRQEYTVASGLLSLLAPLGPEDDRLEVKGYLGGQHVTLMYERDM
jgi:hypothetical protein